MSRFRPLPTSFYRRPAEIVARDLLGRYLVRELEGERLVLRLVEVEAYLGGPDRASHAWDGRRTPRNESLYLPGGHAYVYFIYGMHLDRKSTRLNSSHPSISYAVFCLKKKKHKIN